MSAIDDIHEDLYWQGFERGRTHAARLVKAHEQAAHIIVHRRWENHWRTRVAGGLRRLADRLALPEPRGGSQP